MRNAEDLKGIRVCVMSITRRQTRILEIGKDETVDFIRGDGNGGHHVESRMAELENKDVSLSHYY